MRVRGSASASRRRAWHARLHRAAAQSGGRGTLGCTKSLPAVLASTNCALPSCAMKRQIYETGRAQATLMQWLLGRTCRWTSAVSSAPKSMNARAIPMSSLLPHGLVELGCMGWLVADASPRSAAGLGQVPRALGIRILQKLIMLIKQRGSPFWTLRASFVCAAGTAGLWRPLFKGPSGFR